MSLKQIEGTIAVRDGGIHISSIMLMQIIDHIEVYTSEDPYTGVIVGFYKLHRKGAVHSADYTYGGISSMLRALRRRGFIKSYRHGIRVRHELAQKGMLVLDNLGV